MLRRKYGKQTLTVRLNFFIDMQCPVYNIKIYRDQERRELVWVKGIKKRSAGKYGEGHTALNGPERKKLEKRINRNNPKLKN